MKRDAARSLPVRKGVSCEMEEDDYSCKEPECLAGVVVIPAGFRLGCVSETTLLLRCLSLKSYEVWFVFLLS